MRSSFGPFQTEVLQCESRKSNPAPLIKWYLGEEQLRAKPQVNESEDGDARRWRSKSTLEYKFQKEDFGKPLRCEVEHPAYPTGSQDTTVVLDVLCKSIDRVHATSLLIHCRTALCRQTDRESDQGG